MNLDHDDLQTGGGPAGALPFIYGHVDPTLFPIDRIQEAAQRALRQRGVRALNYGAERGCGPLLAYLQDKIARDEGLELGPDRLILTVGASGGLDAVCRLCTRPGDTILVEAPSYHEAVAIIRDYPVQIAAVPLDESGLIIEALGEKLEALTAKDARPRLLYTIPTFQNPSGVTLVEERRHALLELARRHNLLIVEDDVYRDLAFGTSPPPSLYTLDVEDGGQTVLRLGSFSKILAPGFRLGWLMGPATIVTELTSSGLITSGGGANPFVAYVIAAFCENGWLEPHIARLVKEYRHRRDVMLGALEAFCPREVSWTRPDGGFFVWLTLPEPVRAQEVLAAAHEHSINFLTGEPFFAQGGGEQHIRLPFSFIAPSKMENGIRRLAQIIRDLIAEG